MPSELLSPGLGAEYINEMVVHFRRSFKDAFRLYMKNMMQNGYMWFTEPMTPQERQAYLLSGDADAEMQEKIADPNPNVRAKGVELAMEITEARNGNAPNA